MANEQKHNMKSGATAVAEQPKSETPKTAAESFEKVVKIAPAERKYKLVAPPTTAPRGKQRQIVLKALTEANGEPRSAKDIEPIAKAAGLTANAGVLASVAWHLHQMKLSGQVEIVG